MLAPIPGPAGRPVGFVTAGPDGSPDPLLAAILARYAAAEHAAESHRNMIRRGEIPPDPPIDRWNISDLH
jgi:hypothetical protein